ncbi:MAG TPA: nicotinate-nucleotide adenylyltransferase, partial [Spongiibacteraceae bacterium]|nr:nicotinate-nucleotide adenylyltransferase [Spongiibacteraceae bacterium]
MKSLAIFGGTFDPIHIGHLRSAIEVRELLACDELRFIPCHQPPHRAEPSASSEQRLRMLEFALADEPGLAIDAREIRRNKPSYTIDTLTELRAEIGSQCALHVLIGMDAFAQIDTWRRWRELLDFANLIVIQRPANVLLARGAVADLLQAHRVTPSEVQHKTHGAIAIVELTQLPISATQIRTLIREQRSPRYLLPDSVWQFIRAQHL